MAEHIRVLLTEEEVDKRIQEIGEQIIECIHKHRSLSIKQALLKSFHRIGFWHPPVPNGTPLNEKAVVSPHQQMKEKELSEYLLIPICQLAAEQIDEAKT